MNQPPTSPIILANILNPAWPHDEEPWRWKREQRRFQRDGSSHFHRAHSNYSWPRIVEHHAPRTGSSTPVRFLDFLDFLNFLNFLNFLWMEITKKGWE
jgi:hypothetical protein